MQETSPPAVMASTTAAVAALALDDLAALGAGADHVGEATERERHRVVVPFAALVTYLPIVAAGVWQSLQVANAWCEDCCQPSRCPDITWQLAQAGSLPRYDVPFAYAKAAADARRDAERPGDEEEGPREERASDGHEGPRERVAPPIASAAPARARRGGTSHRGVARAPGPRSGSMPRRSGSDARIRARGRDSVIVTANGPPVQETSGPRVLGAACGAAVPRYSMETLFTP